MQNHNLLSDEDLQDLLNQLSTKEPDTDEIPDEEAVVDETADIELSASQRRYEEIIKKHKADK